MARTLMLAWSTPVEGLEDAFHTWYDQVHIPQVGSVLPVAGEVHRFVVAGPEGPGRYLAIYDLGDTEVPAAAAALDEAATSGVLDMSPAMNLTDVPPEVQFVMGI